MSELLLRFRANMSERAKATSIEQGVCSLVFIGEIASKSQSMTRVHDSFMTGAHLYEVRPRKDRRGVDLISDALPFGRLWYGEPDAVSNAVDYAKHRSRSHNTVIRVYDEAGKRDRDARARGRFQRTVAGAL